MKYWPISLVQAFAPNTPEPATMGKVKQGRFYAEQLADLKDATGVPWCLCEAG